MGAIMEETAYFVNHPRRVSDLRQPHLPEAEQTYAIVQTVTLRPIDYENFSEDLLADRASLTPLAQRGKVLQCIFVTMRGASDGILVVPTDNEHVRCAAYVALSRF